MSPILSFRRVYLKTVRICSRLSMQSKLQIKVLFVAANPMSTDHLDLEGELREILQKIRASKYRDVLQMIPVPAARADDLEQALLEHEPTVVHFSGYGRVGIGMLMRCEDPEAAESFDSESLARLFEILKKKVRLVILNFCHSLEPGRAIAEHVDFVVGMRGRIEDEAAKLFAASFYRAVGFGESVETAFQLGLNAARRRHYGLEDLDPKLLIRDGASGATILIKGWRSMNIGAFPTGTTTLPDGKTCSFGWRPFSKNPRMSR